MTAGFMTPLCVELCKADLTLWELTKSLIYRSDVANDTFIVPRGFRTDFASVPRLPFAFLLFGGIAEEPATLHDYLYTTQCVPRAMADAILVEAMKVTGVPAWRRGPMWLGVRLFGGSHWEVKACPDC